MMKQVVRIGCCTIRVLCLFYLVSLCGCGDTRGWGKITKVRTADKIKPYAQQGPGMAMGIGRRELRVVLPIAGDMGTEALDATAFAERGASVFDDSRCKYGAEECKKAQAYRDPVFVVVSISPKSEMIKWPVRYVLEVTDSRKNKTSYVAIQPLAESSSYSYDDVDEVGFCTRLEGVDGFSLLFIVPKDVAQSMTRVALQSDHGTIKWQKESQSD